ncbi:MAG: cytochrome P450, partial [Novosphingobium sp.]
YTLPLDKFDISDPALFQQDVHWDYFKRLRAEDPVNYCPESPYGPYWSITKYQDILEVDSNWKAFSSFNCLTFDEIRFAGATEDATPAGGFIVMDPPEHDTQRKIVSPAIAPSNIALLESLMRQRTQDVLAELPVGEEFDWVERVSVELTTLMLATLLDFPMERRSELKFWSDAASGTPGDGVIESWEHRDSVLKEMAATFMQLREERRKSDVKPDLISMLAHSPMASDMSDYDYIGNVALLIVGGNDTTRNTMSGSIIAFNAFPDQWEKLRAHPELVESMVPEAIRYQTPVIYLGRRATQDYQLRGKTIRKGDKVIMWFISGNRDEEVIDSPEEFIIDRKRPRQHLSFGFGVHRCLGNRLAEMQLRVLW